MAFITWAVASCQIHLFGNTLHLQHSADLARAKYAGVANITDHANYRYIFR